LDSRKKWGDEPARIRSRGLDKRLRPLIDWIAHYRAFWLERLDRLQALLKEMDE